MLWITNGKEIVYVSYDDCKSWEQYSGNLNEFIMAEIVNDLYETHYGMSIPENDSRQIELVIDPKLCKDCNKRNAKFIFNCPEQVINWYPD